MPQTSKKTNPQNNLKKEVNTCFLGIINNLLIVLEKNNFKYHCYTKYYQKDVCSYMTNIKFAF